MLIRWSIGLSVGTLLFGLASPLFVRSYLPNEVNRGVATLPAGYVYRWRSEGYANTRIGPLGMPGKISIRVAEPDASSNATGTFSNNVALWGDSQAEGVAVPDAQKLFAQIQRASHQRCNVFSARDQRRFSRSLDRPIFGR